MIGPGCEILVRSDKGPWRRAIVLWYDENSGTAGVELYDGSRGVFDRDHLKEASE